MPDASGTPGSRAAPVAALVLGAAVWPGGHPSPTLERRARTGAALWKRGEVGLVIGCGGVGRHPPSEADVIAQICRAEGLPEQAIRREDRSTTTFENIANALPLLRQENITRVVIVTDAYHAPRARLVARRLGLDCTSAAPDPGGASRWRRLRSALREVPAYLIYLTRPGGGR